MVRSEVGALIEFLGWEPRLFPKNSTFLDRLKVQKTAFLLKHLGNRPFTEFAFNTYLHGPYSPDLASVYYGLTGTTPGHLNLSETEKSLVKWFADHDPIWLEVASSILSIKERYSAIRTDELYSVLLMSKPWVTRELFHRAIADLAPKNLLR